MIGGRFRLNFVDGDKEPYWCIFLSLLSSSGRTLYYVGGSVVNQRSRASASIWQLNDFLCLRDM